MVGSHVVNGTVSRARSATLTIVTLLLGSSCTEAERSSAMTNQASEVEVRMIRESEEVGGIECVEKER